MSRKALDLINRSYRSGGTILDLNQCGLSDESLREGSPIDKALRKCNNLQVLILNSTTSDSRYYKEVSASSRLAFPDSEALDFETEFEGKYFSHTNRLTHFPQSVLSLQNLKELYYAFDGQATTLLFEISEISALPNLKKLDLSGNTILSLTSLQDLPSLEILNLTGCNIETIGKISKLKHLKQLILRGNKIQKIASLDKFANLQVLDLSHNLIRALEYLGDCPNLEKLDVSRNEITTVGYLGDLRKLSHLDLSNNRIETINGFKDLPGLKALNLNSNLIRSLDNLNLDHRSIELSAGRNEISSITKEDFLAYFSHDDTIDLDLIKRIKNFIVQMQLFEEAAVIRDLEFKLMMGRAPSEVEIEMVQRYSLMSRLIQKNLTQPTIEIIRQGKEAVLSFYQDLDEKGADYLFEAKMLIVGQPRSGKTTLRNKLLNINSKLPGEDKTTRGIDVERLSFKVIDRDGASRDFFCHIWDFGGQQIYQTTHQFFLTHRSMYILVMDTGKDSTGNDDSTVNYWLQAIELLGGSSPLYLIRNEKNERQINIDMAQKRARFPFLKNDYEIDLNALISGTPHYKIKHVTEFVNLKKDIEDELKKLPLVGIAMPKNWVNIRKELQVISRKKPYISRQEFIDLCVRFEVTDFNKQIDLSRIFHDLGVFLHFQDYVALEDFIILQNVWATDAVFAVFDNTNVKGNNGKFTDMDLPDIWREKGYKEDVYKRLLALMMQFELCYRVEKSNPNIYIVPEMLSDTSPVSYEWDCKGDLPLQYRYDFMPKGLLTRLIVRLHKSISEHDQKQIVWKTGVKLDGGKLGCPHTEAEIIESWDNKQLFLRASGRFAKDLLTKLTHEIDLLNGDFFKQSSDGAIPSKSRWYKMIPCNCMSCKDDTEKHFYDYYKLLERKAFGKMTVECEKIPFDTVNIAELLGDIFTPEDRSSQPNSIQAKRIFISYSHKDESWKDEFIKHLSPLKNLELIVEWNDRQIESGLWDDQIVKAMENCDIFILLITVNFLFSSYITTKEITKAYERFKAGKCKIFPVICDSCDWQLQPITRSEKEFHPMLKKEIYVWLGKFQPFPKDGLPIKNWPNQHDGFLDVMNQLKNHL